MEIKNKIIKLIEEQLKKSIENFEETGSTLNKAADMDEESTRSIDDYSQQANDKELELRVKEQIAAVNQKINWLENNGSGSQDTVAPGALVETKDSYFFVGIALPPNIQVEDKKITGISENAPVYATIEGKRKGDSIKIGDKSVKILNIY